MCWMRMCCDLFHFGYVLDLLEIFGSWCYIDMITPLHLAAYNNKNLNFLKDHFLNIRLFEVPNCFILLVLTDLFVFYCYNKFHFK